MSVSPELVRSVVWEVLRELGHGGRPVANTRTGGSDGVFDDVDEAVAAAAAAQREFARRHAEERRQAIDAIRRICRDQAEELGRAELEETHIGRLEHKIEKLRVAADRVPGIEMLVPRADQGGAGLALTQWAPFGVVGIITPVTHSLPTLAGNAINLLAGGNSLVCNPHPSGARIACRGVQLFNQAIAAAIGITNLLTIIRQPTLASAEALFAHRDVRLLCVTGGPAVARAALRSPKRAIVAGPGNPPVVVDATADLERAARCIIRGAAYDNNLLCIAEKEVFAVASIADEFMRQLEHHQAVHLTSAQLDALTRAAFSPHPEQAGRWVVNKELIGQDAAVLAAGAGLRVPENVELLFAETDADHPFVTEEQMMPMVPIVRAADAAEALKLAKKAEHGFGHTALVHSRDVDFIQQMETEMDVSIFVANGPCMAGLGIGGEGYLSYSIATPTGEGVTTPLTFVRQRRSSWVRGA